MKLSPLVLSLIATSSVTLATATAVTAETRSFELSGFNRIQVSEGLDAEIKVGETFGIKAEARAQKSLDNLDISVRGDTLFIERKRNFSMFRLSNYNDATVFVSLPDLTVIASNKGSDVHVSGEFGDSLVANVSSGAELTLENVTADTVTLSSSTGSNTQISGECVNLSVIASQGASIEAAELKCDVVDAQASSGSDIEVFATETITANAKSGASIEVSGNPSKTTVKQSSGGDVEVND